MGSNFTKVPRNEKALVVSVVPFEICVCISGRLVARIALRFAFYVAEKHGNIVTGSPIISRYLPHYDPFKIRGTIPHKDWGRARTAGNRFARDDKEPGPRWWKQIPGERPRETAVTHEPSARPACSEERRRSA